MRMQFEIAEEVRGYCVYKTTFLAEESNSRRAKP
jgi:hypothetical protein